MDAVQPFEAEIRDMISAREQKISELHTRRRDIDKKKDPRHTAELEHQLMLLLGEVEALHQQYSICSSICRDPMGRVGRAIDEPPAIVLDTIKNILQDKTIDTVFNPFSRDGILISLLDSGIGEKGRGIVQPIFPIDTSKVYHEKLPIEWDLADPFDVLSTIDEKYDLIVTDFVSGLEGPDRPRQFPQFDGISATDEELLILAACLHLSDGGVGIFIVRPNFANNPRGIYANLHRFGLMLDAYLELPTGTPKQAPQLSVGIAIIRKGLQIPVFTGLISEESDRRKSLIDNYLERHITDDITLGALVEFDKFEGFTPLQALDRITRISKKFGYPAHPFGELIIGISRRKQGEDFSEKDNAIYLSSIGIREVTTSPAEIGHHPNYYQIELDRELADAEYIAGHLNSHLGRALLEYGFSRGGSGSVTRRLSRSSLDYIPVFLPPLQVQKLLAEVVRQVKEIEADLNTIKDQLWTEPRKVRVIKKKVDKLTREESEKEWIDTLPFPLATILWAYYTAGKDDKIRYEHLLNFFEAAAEFYSTILLSGAKEDGDLWKIKIPEILEGLKKYHLSFDHSSFGTWSNTFSNLAKEVRRMVQTPELRERLYRVFKTHDPEVVAGLCAKELASLFQETNNLRNQWKGHTGIVGVTEARNRHEALKPHLQRFRQITGSLWNHYFMIYPGGLECLSDDQFQQQILMLRGPNTRFVPGELELTRPLNKDSLYLIGDGEREGLKLLPLIQLSSSPESEMNAIYFFNKTDADAFQYVSYHFEGKPAKAFPPSEIAHALNGLLESPPS